MLLSRNDKYKTYWISSQRFLNKNQYWMQKKQCWSFYKRYIIVSKECYTLKQLESKVIGLCHQHRASSACISLYFDPTLYCWLNTNFHLDIPKFDNEQFQRLNWTSLFNKFSSLRVNNWVIISINMKGSNLTTFFIVIALWNNFFHYQEKATKSIVSLSYKQAYKQFFFI
jgi:hypothetical protein